MERTAEVLNNLDWPLLVEQRLTLMEVISTEKMPPAEQVEILWGLVNLLDDLTDSAITDGFTTEQEALMRPEEG